jgi:hypothetical protein
MSDNAILTALWRLGSRKDAMSGNGFRAMARTILQGWANYLDKLKAGLT